MLNLNVKLICDAQTTFSNLLVEEGSSVTLPTEKDSDTKPVGEIQHVPTEKDSDTKPVGEIQPDDIDL